MTNLQFKNDYEYAKKVRISQDVFFNHAGYFWLALTNRQQNKMCKLMIEQGDVVEDGGISLANGLKINYKGDE